MVSYGLKSLLTGCKTLVLILIVMDNGLLPIKRVSKKYNKIAVLILIVMDNGLLPRCRR